MGGPSGGRESGLGDRIAAEVKGHCTLHHDLFPRRNCWPAGTARQAGSLQVVRLSIGCCPQEGPPALHHHHGRGSVPSVLAGLHTRDMQPGLHSGRHSASMHAAHDSALS